MPVDLSQPIGVVAQVSGTSGAAWTLYATPADRPWPDDPWMPVSSGIGDLVVAVEIPKRQWFFYLATSAECTPPQRFGVTDGLDALATRCRAAVIAVLKGLALDGIGDRVADQVYPDGSELRTPAISVHLMNLNESQEPGLNGLDYISYPVRALVFDTDCRKTDHSISPVFERWRQAIYRAFRDQHLPGVPEVAYVRVEPLLIAQADLDGPQYDQYAGGFVIRCVAREPRGIGA